MSSSSPSSSSAAAKRFIVAAHGTEFSSDWVAGWCKMVTALVQKPETSVNLRIPPAHLERSEIMQWIVNGLPDASEFDRLVVVDAGVMPSIEVLESMLGSPSPVTCALHVSDNGRELSAVEKFDPALVGKEKMTPLSVSPDVQFPEVEMCGMGFFTTAAGVIKDAKFAESYAKSRAITNEQGTFTLDVLASVCRAFVGAGVKVAVDTKARCSKWTKALVSITDDTQPEAEPEAKPEADAAEPETKPEADAAEPEAKPEADAAEPEAKPEADTGAN